MDEFVIETYKIFELTDWNEYINLTGNPTKYYNLIISAGKVNLSEDSVAKTLLWDMFPEGTITGNNFRDVANGLIAPPPIEEE